RRWSSRTGWCWLPKPCWKEAANWPSRSACSSWCPCRDEHPPMNLRRNALVLAVLTALIAVLADWSGNEALRSLWRIPAGLLLLGLAYESLIARRARVTLTLDAPRRWYLGRANSLRMRLQQQLHRSLVVEIAATAPPPF